MDYSLILSQLSALSDGVKNEITILSNASALLFSSLDGLNWCGFYLFDGEKLLLGPFQGKPACTEIPLSKGVCGRAASELKTQRVGNVHLFPGHIACDSASNSEIVLPLLVDGSLYGVLDIDSLEYDRFSEDDEKGLTAFADLLTKILSKK